MVDIYVVKLIYAVTCINSISIAILSDDKVVCYLSIMMAIVIFAAILCNFA